MGEMDQIDIKAMLLEIRQYRLGLIQTPDQLRFTYLAILEGVQVLMPDVYQRAENQHVYLQASAGKLLLVTLDNVTSPTSHILLFIYLFSELKLKFKSH